MLSRLPEIGTSFLLLFGGLALACAVLLFSSVRRYSFSGGSSAHTRLGPSYLDSWHIPNLKKWKAVIYNFLYWVRDISVRYWALRFVSYIKLTLYRLIRISHKKLLGTIKYLEHHEDKLKERLSEKSVLESRSATEQRLVRTLSKRQYTNQPINFK
jgi:hypothetical protein